MLQHNPKILSYFTQQFKKDLVLSRAPQSTSVSIAIPLHSAFFFSVGELNLYLSGVNSCAGTLNPTFLTHSRTKLE